MEKASSRFPEWVSTNIIEFYKEQGISKLFEWQIGVLNKASHGENQNFIFSAPTSAGKSIVSELIGWQVASTGKKVIFVLPYISVAREKLYQIQKCWRRCDIPVCGFIGPQSSNPNEWLGAVCTIEKAASLINRALSENWFQEIGMVVVDELHMVFDTSRGAHIEHMLTKILHWNKNENDKIRIIGMSATIPELRRVGDWLDANIYEASFRPIAMKNHIVVGTEMRKLNNRDVLRQFSEDPVITLTEESFKQNLQTIVMVSSKIDAEKVAMNVAMRLRELSTTDSSLIDRLKLQSSNLLFVKNGLERNGCKDRVLLASLAWGVAFHHAGLTLEEKECIELGFREKSIIILVATSTLASGVNLPAERVIIKAQTRGPSALTSLSYRQMAGRAGRTGYATRGESYLIVKKCDYEAVLKIINTPIDKYGRIGNKKIDMTNLCRFILEGICTGLTTTKDEVVQLCSLMLFEHEVVKNCASAIDMLLNNSFISIEENELSPTQLGRAAIASSLPPEASLTIFKDLCLASQAIALDTELHMLYLVTPINVSVWQECDWHHLFSLFAKLPKDHLRIARLVGASERFILDQLQGRRNDSLLQVHTRFFSALALFDLINEMSIYEVSQKYKISRGCLQTLQTQSATYAAMIVAFCQRLGWTYLKALLDGFAMRLMFGIRSELSELVSIEGIDGRRARILHEKGITCVSHLSACETSQLAHFLTLAVPYSSSNSNDGLGEWLFGEPRVKVDVAAKMLKERARTVLMKKIQDLGLTVQLPSVENDDLKETEKENEECVQDSCDSGLPESCSEAGNLDEMVRSVSDMSLVDEVDDLIEYTKETTIKTNKEEVYEELEHEVNEIEIDCLETSLLKMRAPKDEKFLRRISQTFSPALKSCDSENDTTIQDSFDNSVTRISPLAVKTPNRNHASPMVSMDNTASEDSFDRPVVKTVPLNFSKRKSLLDSIINSSSNRRDSMESIASNEKSFDVFLTPPAKLPKTPRIGAKHNRSEEYNDSKLATYFSSPAVKQVKVDKTIFRMDTVCDNTRNWKKWMRTAMTSSQCALSIADDFSGVALDTDSGTVFISLLDACETASNPNCTLSTEHSKCKIPLDNRLECLKQLLNSYPVCIVSMKSAFLLYEKFGFKIRHVCVVRVAAHLNYLVDPESENDDNHNWFASLLRRSSSWNFDIHKLFTSSTGQQKTAIEAFSLSQLFENLKNSAIGTSKNESFNLEMISCQTVLDMFYNGISFDHSSCLSFTKTYRRKLENLSDQIWKLSHGKFNIDSSNEVANALFHRLGLLYPETAGCKVKQKHLPTNKRILEKIRNQHPIVGKILEYRHIQYAVNQCLLPLSKYENRIHCWFEMCTSSGRIFTIQPNLQNVPKRVSENGLSVRNLFKASQGKVLIGADFKQLELRVLAHLSNDQALVKLISQERDLFEELAMKWIFSRDAVKQLCYGIIYGMGAKSLSELTEMKVEEAAKMLNEFFSMFPGVRSFINETKQKITDSNQVETILGRKRQMSPGLVGEEKARVERAAVNYTIQGSASEIFKTAIVEINSRIQKYESKILMTIHDEVLVECPENLVATVSEIVRNCMENSLSAILRVPMRVSLKTGRSWAELK